MGKARTTPAWKKILDLCDQLEELRERLSAGDDPLPARRRIRAAMEETVAEIRRRAAREAKSGDLSGSAAKHGLTPDSLAILAILLSRYVSGSPPDLEGREILDILFTSSYEKIEGVALIGPEGSLRATGLVEAEIPPKGHDPLDARIRLAPKLAKAFCDSGIAAAPGPKTARPQPYRSHREYLLDLKLLCSLHHQRAARLFDPERFLLAPSLQSEIRGIGKRIEAVRNRIESSLEATPNAASFAALRFRREFNLGEDEMLIVIALLFREMLEGEGAASAAELIQIASHDEEDLLRKRKLLAKGSTLVSRQIVQLEDMSGEKEITAEASLSNWVAERLLAEERAEQAIAPDEKIDFHNYLKNLESADTFLEDLKGT